MAVVAIAQQIGSRGLELGKLVAAQLQYPLMGPAEITAEATREYQCTAEQINLIDERQPRWWERLTAETARVGVYFRAVVMKQLSPYDVVVVGRSIPLMTPPEPRHGLRIPPVPPFR